MSIQKKCDALNDQVAEKVKQLRKTANDPNASDCDRQRARRKLAKYRDLLLAQAADAANGGKKARLEAQ